MNIDIDLNSTYVFVDIPEDFIFVDKFEHLVSNGEQIYKENIYYDKLIQFNLKKWIESLNQKRFEGRKACDDDNWKQFVLDAWRSNIYINNNYVSDPITVKNKYNHLDPMMKNRIWIFSSQTAFVIPVELLSNEIMDKGYYLAEISNQDSERFNVNKKMIVNIVDCKKKDYFVLTNSKVLRIFKLEKDFDVTLALVYIDLEFNINKPEDSFFKIEFKPVVDK